MMFTFETQRPVCWTSVTTCFVFLASLCCCNGTLHQETVNMADPLQGASESSRMPDTTEQELTPAADLGALLDAGVGAVVTLVAGGTRLAAHRAVLAAGSPVFAAMLHPDTLEASSSEVDIPGMEGPVLRQLVAFLYTGRAPQLPGMALHLLAAAEKYGVSALKDSSEQLVAEQLAVENAAATAVLALRYDIRSLSQAAVAFIKDHLEVVATKGWADAVLNHPGYVMQITRLLRGPPADTSATTATDSTPIPTAATTATLATADITSNPIAVASASNTAASTAAESISTTNAATVAITPDATTATPATADITSIPIAVASASNTATPTAAESMSTTTAATAVITPNATTGTPTTTDITSTSSADTPATPMGCHYNQPPDAAAVSLLRGLPAEETGRRLIQAAKRGSVQELRALLAAGADVEARDGGRWTPLHQAADYGQVEATQCLLQAGAEVDSRDKWQWTPLHWAADRGRTAVVRLLLAASADLNARDEVGRTALHWAAMNNRAELASVLLRAGADRGVRNNSGQTALEVARARNNWQVMQVLQ